MGKEYRLEEHVCIGKSGMLSSGQKIIKMTLWEEWWQGCGDVPLNSPQGSLMMEINFYAN